MPSDIAGCTAECQSVIFALAKGTQLLTLKPQAAAVSAVTGFLSSLCYAQHKHKLNPANA